MKCLFVLFNFLAPGAEPRRWLRCFLVIRLLYYYYYLQRDTQTVIQLFTHILEIGFREL